MRFLFVIAFICISHTSLVAQGNYHSIIDTAKEWYALHALQNLYWTHIYQFTGEDTLIGSNKYNILIDNEDVEFFMREDSSRKVFLYKYGSDQLLYDFNASVNDTIFFNFSGSNFYQRITKIDSIEIDGDFRKHYHVETNWYMPYELDGVHYYNSWIEGIGSTRYSIMSYFQPDIVYSLKFCGLKKDGMFIYPDSIDHCYTISDTGLNYTDSNTILIYPVPFKDKIYIESNIISDIELYDSNGRKIKFFAYRDYPDYRGIEYLKRYTEDTDYLPPGLYFIKITDIYNKVSMRKIIKAP